MWTNRIFRLGAGCGMEVRGGDLHVVAVKSRPAGVTVLGRTVLGDFRKRPPLEWGGEYATFLQNLGLSHLSAAVALPRHEVTVRQIQLPRVTGKELAAAVLYQLDGLHPYGEGEVYHAFSALPAPEGAEKRSVAVVITEKVKVDGYADLFEAAEIPVAAFTVAAAAFYAGVRVRWDHPPIPFVVADFHDHRLEVYGEAQERPVLSVEFDLRVQPLERALRLTAADLRLEDSESAALIACGETQPPEGGELAVGRHDLGGLAGFRPQAPEELLPAPLRSVLEFDTRRDAACYATALEAACPRLGWRANLLPPERRKSSSRWMYAPTAVLAGLLLLLGIGFWLRPVVQDGRYAAAMEAETTRLETIVARVEEAKSESGHARERLALLESLRGRTPSDLRILSELSALLPETVWLSNIELNDQGVRVTGEAANAAPLLGILSNAQTIDTAAFTSSLVETDAGQRFQIVAERKSAEGGQIATGKVPTGGAAPQAGPAATTLSTLGEQDSKSSGGPR